MKPHHLSMTAFGPYPDTVEVDFDSLAPHGLFLLHGPTGAGKSSLLDGLCFALYGSVPGLRSVKRLRSDHASVDTLCSVTLEATVAGRRIRITRRPEQERPKKRGDGMTAEKSYVLLEEQIAGEWSPVSGSVDEVGEEISQRMGMSAAQFAKVVLLPQGRFAEFLHASSDERAKLLEQLFATHRFRSVEDWLAERRRDSSNRLEDQERVIADVLARFSEAAGVEPDSEDAVGWAVAQRSAADEDVHASELAAARAVEVADAARVAREVTEAAFHASETHRTATARLVELEAQSLGLVEVSAELDAATRAESARLLAERAESTALAQTAAFDHHCGALRATGLEVAASADQLRGGARESTARLGFLESLRPVADELAGSELELASFRQAQERAEIALAAAHAERVDIAGRLLALAEQLQAAFAAAEQKVGTARTEEQRIREARLAGMGAELAAALAEGEPCPVCGATEHPSPATPGFAQVTLEDEQTASAGVLAAERVASATRAELEVAAAELQKLPGQPDPIPAAWNDSAPELGAALAEVTATIAALATEVASSQVSAAASAALSASLRDKLADAVGAHADLETAISHEAQRAHLLETAALAAEALDAATGAARDAAAALEAKLAGCGFTCADELVEALRSDDWRAHAEAAIRDHSFELDFARRRVAELGDTPLAADLDAATAVEAAARSELELAQAGVTKATMRADSLERLLPALLSAVEAAEPLREERRLAKELADLAGGEGSNVLRMRLSTYVLAARLEEVAAAASVRLAKMTAGRFTLGHTDEKSGRSRSGLGLVVHDSHTGHARETATLSGGETFMASLALALGLAEIVGHETGGNPIEALFVDEGFGTLDEETLEQVMDILDSLRDGGRMVGIVSHVTDLRQRIRAQIKVTRSMTGSTLEVLSA